MEGCWPTGQWRRIWQHFINPLAKQHPKSLTEGQRPAGSVSRCQNFSTLKYHRYPQISCISPEMCWKSQKVVIKQKIRKHGYHPWINRVDLKITAADLSSSVTPSPGNMKKLWVLWFPLRDVGFYWISWVPRNRPAMAAMACMDLDMAVMTFPALRDRVWVPVPVCPTIGNSSLWNNQIKS